MRRWGAIGNEHRAICKLPKCSTFGVGNCCLYYNIGIYITHNIGVYITHNTYYVLQEKQLVIDWKKILQHI